MTIIRSAFTSDLHDLVSMYKNLTLSIRLGQKIGSDFYFYKAVIAWIEKGYDIIISENSGVVSGFCLSYVDDLNGLSAPLYYVDSIFVKTEYRNTKAFYLMQENSLKIAQSKKISLISDAVPSVEKIHKKLGGVKVTQRHEWRYTNG